MDQTISHPHLAPTPPPVMIGGAIPLIDVAGFLAGTPGAAEKAAAEKIAKGTNGVTEVKNNLTVSPD